jgi:hypothetical protein
VPAGKLRNFFFFFASIKSLKEGVGSGSISRRYRSVDPDPHQNVTDSPTLWAEPHLNYREHGGDRQADAQQHVEGDEELVQLYI